MSVPERFREFKDGAEDAKEHEYWRVLEEVARDPDADSAELLGQVAAALAATGRGQKEFMVDAGLLRERTELESDSASLALDRSRAKNAANVLRRFEKQHRELLKEFDDLSTAKCWTRLALDRSRVATSRLYHVQRALEERRVVAGAVGPTMGGTMCGNWGIVRMHGIPHAHGEKVGVNRTADLQKDPDDAIERSQSELSKRTYRSNPRTDEPMNHFVLRLAEMAKQENQ